MRTETIDSRTLGAFCCKLRDNGNTTVGGFADEYLSTNPIGITADGRGLGVIAELR